MEMSACVKLAWQLAAQEAVAAGKPEIGPVQMFCGIAKLQDILQAHDVVPQLMSAEELRSAQQELETVLRPLIGQGVEVVTLRRMLRARVGTGTHRPEPTATISRSQVLKSLFERARSLSACNDEPLRLRELLIVMLQDRNLLVSCVLSEHKVDLDAVIRQLQAPSAPAAHVLPDQAVQPRSDTPLLNRFGRDLTLLARSGALGPVIGRRPEVLQVMQTLLRRTKSNPVLVGEPGVGKTAVAELLAIRLAAPDCPEAFADARVIELSLSALLAGASHAGERELRLNGVLAECRANPHVVVFIDELHTLVKAGGAGGAIDPADIFKPALARGELRCIGATTHDEYARHIEADPALERRFQKVPVAEPSPQQALEMLRGLRSVLEAHHGVLLPDVTLQAAVDLAVRFDAQHHLPDKAIDLLDLAAARTQLPRLSMAGDPDLTSRQAATVSADTVAHALAAKLGLPVELLTTPARAPSMEALETHLKTCVVGQEGAASAIAQRLMLAQGRLRERDGPLGVFLFIGPTGVGKTAMAKALASFLFHDEHALIRLDMSEFMEEHSVAKLTGAPPGYVGHDQAGQLTGRLRARPHSLVLLDEIEKAHPRVLDLFLQLFDEGRLTDSKGRTADARHALFIMTGNIHATRKPAIGFAVQPTLAPDSSLDTDLRRYFRAELLNRIDQVLVFDPLAMEHIIALVTRNLAEIAGSLSKRNVTLHVRPGVVEHLARAGCSPEYGVRHLQRTIERLVEAPLLDILRQAPQEFATDVALSMDQGAVTVLTVRS